jgi:LysR family transcriptional activator of glutamate synthase operon
MQTDWLRWFQQVVDGATVTDVADVFMVSQPGVSRALTRLEEEVGTPLLEKRGRVLRPTHAGTVFKRHVDALIHAYDDGLAAVDELIAPGSGTVTVAFQPSLGTWLVPDTISRFRDDYPSVQFRLVQADDARGSSLVAAASVDLEFTARRPREPSVHWERLFNQPLGLAVARDHPVAGRDTISLAEVARENFVMFRPAWELRTLSERLCAAAGFTPHVAFEGDDLSVVRGFVAAGLGVAVIPTTEEEMTSGDRGHRVLRLTDDGASRTVGVAWSQERRLLPSADLFRQFVLRSPSRGG